MKEWVRFRRLRHCGNVYNFPSYGAVGNTVCRMWESCPLLFHILQTVLSMAEWGVMHISTMRFWLFTAGFPAHLPGRSGIPVGLLLYVFLRLCVP